MENFDWKSAWVTLLIVMVALAVNEMVVKPAIKKTGLVIIKEA